MAVAANIERRTKLDMLKLPSFMVLLVGFIDEDEPIVSIVL